ncbi:MAG: LLM class flavin-dependent oxidoreductase [Acidobacteriota bacterium]
MQHSLFWLLDHYPETGESIAALHQAALEEAAEADRLGFRSLWLAEHHFLPVSTVPNPAVLLAAMAQRTHSLRLGPATAVLPLRHPAQVVEDYAMVDSLSGGRLNLGVGSGSDRSEYEPFGIAFEDRRELYREHLAEIRQRWRTAAEGQLGPSSVNVAPIQGPAPPIYVATMNADTAYRVGLAGDSLLTLISPATESLEEVAERVEQHARGLREAGAADASAEAIVMAFAHVAETEEEARSTAIPALARLMHTMSGSPLPDAEAFYLEMKRKGIGLFGTRQEVAAKIDRLADLGIDHLAFVSRFGGMPKGCALHSLRRLSNLRRIAA